MSGFEIAVGVSTIGGFLSQVASHELSRNKSSKIRVPLTQAKVKVSEAIDVLEKHQQILDRQIFNRFLGMCRRLDERIDEQLKDSLKKKNFIKKTLQYSLMVKEAREIHDESMGLFTETKFASLQAMMQENDKDANIKANAEDEAIATKEREFKTTKHKELFAKSEREHTGTDIPPVAIVDDTSAEWEEHRVTIALFPMSQLYP